MKYIKFVSMFLIAFLLFGGLSMAQIQAENEEARKKYDQAKKMIYEKDWEKAIESLKHILGRLEESDYLDDSLYWLGYSLNKLSVSLENVENQLEIQEEALQYLNQLIEKFSKSSWVDDAEFLRIEIAESLVKKGLNNYRKYINGSVEGVKVVDPEHVYVDVILPEQELKLVALDALLSIEEEKAFPILVKMVKEEKMAPL